VTPPARTAEFTTDTRSTTSVRAWISVAPPTAERVHLERLAATAGFASAMMRGFTICGATACTAGANGRLRCCASAFGAAAGSSGGGGGGGSSLSSCTWITCSSITGARLAINSNTAKPAPCTSAEPVRKVRVRAASSGSA
jgi:hypothetical protein